MRALRLLPALCLSLACSTSAFSQNLQPESRQEFQRVYGSSGGGTAPQLVPLSRLAKPLQDDTRKEFLRIYGQNKLAPLTDVQEVTTPVTIDSTALLAILESTPLRKYFLLWHHISLDLTAIDHRAIINSSPNTYHEQFGPARTARALALIHQAMFEAENAFSQKYASTLAGDRIVPATDASRDAALVEAAYQTMIWLYPGLNDHPLSNEGPANTCVTDQFSLARYYVCSMTKIGGSLDSKNAGIDVGRAIAGRIIAERSNDGSARPEPVWDKDFVSRRVPGGSDYPYVQWTRDPISSLATALGGYWGTVKPFAMTSGFQFRPDENILAAKQPATWDKLPSYKAVRDWGRDPRINPIPANDPNAPPKHGLLLAQFWAYDGTANLCAPARLYNQIALSVLAQLESKPDDGYRAIDLDSTVELARYFALINLAMADAAVAAWDAKYHFQYPRPVTYIRAFEEKSGNPSNPKWLPVGAQVTNSDQPYNITPPFPSYPSGHAVFGGAVFGMLRQFIKPEIVFQFQSDEFNGKNKDALNYIRCSNEDATKDPLFCGKRDFNLDCAERENADSRLFMGVHWIFDADDGITMGNKVAREVYKKLLRPLPNASSGAGMQPPKLFSAAEKKRDDLLCAGVVLPRGLDGADKFGALKVETVLPN